MENKSNFESDKALNPTVLKLGLISFFADVASEMLYPITPIFLTTILGASVTSVGIIEGIAEAIASLLKTYSGIWSDRISKRKPFLLIGYFLGAISKPITGLSHSWIGVLSARAIDRTGKGIRTAPRDALIADSVSVKNRGAAFGWHRGIDTFGAAVGPVFAIILLSYNSNNLRPLYYWAIIPGLLSVFVILLIREPKHKIQNSEQKKWENPFSVWSKFDVPFKKYIYAWGVFSLVNSSDVFLLLKAKSTGLSTQKVILLYCSYNLVYSFSSPYLGKLSDTIGRKKLLLTGLLIFTFVYTGFGFAFATWQFSVLFLIYGLYMGATEGIGKAMAIDLAPQNLKASSIGVLGTVTGICTIVASTVAGILWDHVGTSWTFFFGAFGAAVTFLLLLNINVDEL
ncbi:MAG: MFS transporter [Rhizobacter sp.]|nr:MFS transporter [Bacteriovorax sp.]